MPAPPFQHDDLLCETCGYLLNGLRIDDHCPECGRPVRDSHPHRRIGTLWQRTASARASIPDILRHPRRTFEQAVPEIADSRALKHICLAAAGLVTAFTLVPLYILENYLATGSLGQLSEPALLILIANAGLFGMPVALALALLTTIELLGIRAFGRIHRRRIDARVAETIVGHAAAAWLALPLLITLFWLFGAVLRHLAITYPWALWELTLTAPLWAPAIGALVAMLWFESVVWTGVRRMRFANPPDAAARLSD